MTVLLSVEANFRNFLIGKAIHRHVLTSLFPLTVPQTHRWVLLAVTNKQRRWMSWLLTVDHVPEVRVKDSNSKKPPPHNNSAELKSNVADVTDKSEVRAVIARSSNQSIHQWFFKVAQVTEGTTGPLKCYRRKGCCSKNVSKWRPHDFKVGAETMCSGREFRILATATGKARLPTVESLTEAQPADWFQQNAAPINQGHQQ